MSGRQITYFILVCDGCKTELEQQLTSKEARGLAYSLGWRYPPRITTRGDLAKESSDVCPECLPDWQPAPISNRGGRHKKDGT